MCFVDSEPFASGRSGARRRVDHEQMIDIAVPLGRQLERDLASEAVTEDAADLSRVLRFERRDHVRHVARSGRDAMRRHKPFPRLAVQAQVDQHRPPGRIRPELRGEELCERAPVRA